MIGWNNCAQHLYISNHRSLPAGADCGADSTGWPLALPVPAPPAAACPASPIITKPTTGDMLARRCTRLQRAGARPARHQRMLPAPDPRRPNLAFTLPRPTAGRARRAALPAPSQGLRRPARRRTQLRLRPRRPLCAPLPQLLPLGISVSVLPDILHLRCSRLAASAPAPGALGTSCTPSPRRTGSGPVSSPRSPTITARGAGRAGPAPRRPPPTAHGVARRPLASWHSP